MIFTIILAIFIIINIKCFFKCLKYKLLYKDKAIFLFVPVFGTIAVSLFGYIYKKDFLFVQKYLARTYPNAKIIITNFFLDSMIVLIDPALIKEFVQRHGEFNKRILMPDAVLLNHGLLMAEGPTWKLQRQILSQSFSFDELKQRVPKIKQIAIERLEQQNLQNENVKLLSLFAEITGEVVIQTFFGNENSMKELLNGRKASVEISEFIGDMFHLQRNLYYFYKLKFFRQNFFNYFPTKKEIQLKSRLNALSNIITQIVLKKVQEHLQQKDKNCQYVHFVDIYIDYFVKNNINIDGTIIQEICSQFMTIFFAGTDTTAHLLSFMTYQLAVNPKIQEIIRQETNSIDFQDIDMKSLSSLPKTQAFINEVLRLYPPTPFIIMRKCSTNLSIQEFKFPKGQLINSSFVYSMNNTKYFENPTEFNIDRWDKELKEPFSFTPFSAGPRHCIGQHLAILEAKIIIGVVLKNYELEKIAGKAPKLVAKILYEFQDDNLVKFLKMK